MRNHEVSDGKDACSVQNPLTTPLPSPLVHLRSADMAAMLRPAVPCSFGLAVVPTLEYYTGGFGGQIDGLGVEIARVIAPADGDLAEWVKSCLQLDEYGEDEPMDPYGGWSPGRSVAVNVVTRVGALASQETLYYKCLDHGRSDVQAFAELVPGCMVRWVGVWRKFLIASWNMLSRRGMDTQRVRVLIQDEIEVWDPRWVRMVAENLDASLGAQTTARQRAHLRAWSVGMVQQYERGLVRPCTESAFLHEPLNVLRLIQHGHTWAG